MSASPIVALTDIRACAIEVFHEEAETRARACQRGKPALRSITEISIVRYGIASQSTAQK
jgi:hypothetical protein